MEWCDVVVRTLGLEARALLGPHYGLSITAVCDGHAPILPLNCKIDGVILKFVQVTSCVSREVRHLQGATEVV